MRFSTLDCATIRGGPIDSRVMPSLASSAFPPVWSVWTCVLTIQRTGPSDKLPDLRHDLRRERREAGVHQHYSVLAHLHGDVAAVADQHVDVALDGQHGELHVVEIWAVAAERRQEWRRGTQECERQRGYELNQFVIASSRRLQLNSVVQVQ